jgi:uncharacterized protein YbgA (DUF1722 family)
MAIVTDLAEKAAAGLRALQDLQRCYDDEMWDISDPAFSKLRHIHIHLSNTIGKFARALEPVDHQDHRSVIDRYRRNAQRLAPESEFAKL